MAYHHNSVFNNFCYQNLLVLWCLEHLHVLEKSAETHLIVFVFEALNLV